MYNGPRNLDSEKGYPKSCCSCRSIAFMNLLIPEGE